MMTMLKGLGLLLALGGLLMAAGCSEDECVTCVEPQVLAPTQVYSVSGDGKVTLYWNDYPEIYSPDIAKYIVWSRYYEIDDEDNPDRIFEYIDEVNVGENYDASTGQYFYVDDLVTNAVDFEYAVSAVTTDGRESYLSFEFVVDTPLPMSETALTLFDYAGANSDLSGFDFSLAAEHGNYDSNGAEGVVDPTIENSTADIYVEFDDAGVPWLKTTREDIHVQDYGTFLDGAGQLYFEGVSWAPLTGYSESGVLELIAGHIYVVQIMHEPAPGDIHYAKLGVSAVDGVHGFAKIHWAYQLVNGLPELAAPEPRKREDSESQAIRL
jgi:hypothetical protein